MIVIFPSLWKFFLFIATSSASQNKVSISSSTSNTWGSKISTKNLQDPSFWTVTFLYPCIYGILVDIAVKLFALLALRLTNFENHRTQTTFVNRFILKVRRFLYFYKYNVNDITVMIILILFIYIIYAYLYYLCLFIFFMLIYII